MAWVERRATRTSQPQDAVGIDQSKAKETGTVWAAVFSEKGTIRDQIGGARSTNPGGDGVSRGGKIATFNGSQQGVVPFSLPSGATFGKGLVIAARVRATAAQAGTPGCAFGLAASTGSQTSIGIGFDPSYNVGASWLTSSGAGITAYSPSAANAWVTVFVQCANTNSGLVYYRSWINGIPATTSQGSSVAGTQGSIDELSIGAQHRSAGYLRQFKGDIEWAAVLNVPGADDFTLTDDAALNLYNSGYPYSLFEPEVQRLWVDDATTAAPPGDPTGTLAATETGSDSAALSGQIVVQGALAATETGTDTAAISGSSAVTISGSLAATEAGNDSAAAIGTVLVQGALAVTEVGNDTAVINGSSTIITTGSVNATEAGSDTAAMTGAVLVQALIDAAEQGADTGSMVGQIVVSGVLAASEVGGDTALIYSTEPVIITAGAITKGRPGSIQTSGRPRNVQTGVRVGR